MKTKIVFLSPLLASSMFVSLAVPIVGGKKGVIDYGPNAALLPSNGARDKKREGVAF